MSLHTAPFTNLKTKNGAERSLSGLGSCHTRLAIWVQIPRTYIKADTIVPDSANPAHLTGRWGERGWELRKLASKQLVCAALNKVDLSQTRWRLKPEVALWPLHGHCGMCAHACTHTYTHRERQREENKEYQQVASEACTREVPSLWQPDYLMFLPMHLKKCFNF